MSAVLQIGRFRCTAAFLENKDWSSRLFALLTVHDREEFPDGVVRFTDSGELFPPIADGQSIPDHMVIATRTHDSMITFTVRKEPA